MGSLIWKQWRENRGYLLLFSAWMLLGTAYCVGYECAYQFRAAIGSFSGTAMLYATCAAVFLAMRTAQEERTSGTLPFTSALPVSMRRVAGVRMTAAAATLALPIVLGAILVTLALATGLIEQVLPRDAAYTTQLPDRATGSLIVSLEQLWSVTTIAILGGVELLIVLSLVGCWLGNQAQVGFLGAVFGLGTMILAGFGWMSQPRNEMFQLVYGSFIPQSLVVQWSYGTETGSYTDHELATYRWAAMGLASLLLLILGAIFTTQYGRLPRPASEKTGGSWRWRLPSVWSYVPFRPAGPAMAQIWLELRQAFPLAFYGALLAILVTVATIVMEGDIESPGSSFAQSFQAQLPHTVFFVGMLWSTVVAAGLYSADLGERLGSFWRSRPISPAMWFWTKFFVGLLMVEICLDAVSIAVSWNGPRGGMTQGMSWSFVACFPLLHAWMYTLAVLGTCVVRKPVIGGFLAIFTYMVLMIVVTSFPQTNWMEPLQVYNDLLFAERQSNDSFFVLDNPLLYKYSVVYGTMVASIVLFSVLAYRAARPLEPEQRWTRFLTA